MGRDRETPDPGVAVVLGGERTVDIGLVAAEVEGMALFEAAETDRSVLDLQRCVSTGSVDVGSARPVLLLRAIFAQGFRRSSTGRG